MASSLPSSSSTSATNNRKRRLDDEEVEDLAVGVEGSSSGHGENDDGEMEMEEMARGALHHEQQEHADPHPREHPTFPPASLSFLQLGTTPHPRYTIHGGRENPQVPALAAPTSAATAPLPGAHALPSHAQLDPKSVLTHPSFGAPSLSSSTAALAAATSFPMHDSEAAAQNDAGRQQPPHPGLSHPESNSQHLPDYQQLPQPQPHQQTLLHLQTRGLRHEHRQHHQEQPYLAHHQHLLHHSGDSSMLLAASGHASLSGAELSVSAIEKLADDGNHGIGAGAGRGQGEGEDEDEQMGGGSLGGGGGGGSSSGGGGVGGVGHVGVHGDGHVGSTATATTTASCTSNRRRPRWHWWEGAGPRAHMVAVVDANDNVGSGRGAHAYDGVGGAGVGADGGEPGGGMDAVNNDAVNNSSVEICGDSSGGNVGRDGGINTDGGAGGRIGGHVAVDGVDLGAEVATGILLVEGAAEGGDRNGKTAHGKRKLRKCLDIDTKLAIIRLVREGKSHVSIASEFGVTRTTVSKMLKNAEKIEMHSSALPSTRGRKSLRVGDHAELEQELYKWYMAEVSKHQRVNGCAIKAKAAELIERYPGMQFRVSNGWLDGFKNRFRISSRRGGGAAATVTSAAGASSVEASAVASGLPSADMIGGSLSYGACQDVLSGDGSGVIGVGEGVGAGGVGMAGMGSASDLGESAENSMAVVMAAALRAQQQQQQQQQDTAAVHHRHLQHLQHQHEHHQHEQQHQDLFQDHHSHHHDHQQEQHHQQQQHQQQQHQLHPSAHLVPPPHVPAHDGQEDAPHHSPAHHDMSSHAHSHPHHLPQIECAALPLTSATSTSASAPLLASTIMSAGGLVSISSAGATAAGPSAAGMLHPGADLPLHPESPPQPAPLEYHRV